MKTVVQLWTGLLAFQCIVVCAFASDPKFDPTTRMRLVLVPADAAVGSVIYRLRASDDEFDYPLKFELIGDAASSTVRIETLKCTKYNSICQANVVLIRRLEPGRYYDFKVSVKDTKGGMSVQSCSITATNYTTPHDVIFPHKTGIIMVPEDAKRGTLLDYVIARKNPLSPKDVILELHGSPLFAIRQKIVSPETTEGTINLLGPLDFETQSMYHLTVLANDAYAEPGQDTRNIAGLEIVVIVQDVQDVPPIFTIAPPVTKLPSGLIPGDKILHVHAEDGDKGNPREIRYGLVSEGNPFTSFFNINDTTGEIFLLKPLDEISAITHVGDPILLTVVAEEVKVMRNEPPAMATTVQLALFLPERSNSPPYFENDHYVARIDENALQGTALVFSDPYVPRVSDDDTGKNGVFSLTLLGNNGTFEISPNVAERRANFLIYVRDNHLLDYEERHSVQFQILAQELGPATNLSATVNVVVYINDVNDNPPVFAQEMYIAEIPENITAGQRVIQVHATDVDTGLGGRVRYTAILGYLNTSLNLNPENGLITISTNNHGFDREQMPEYHLYVEARDNDGMGNSAQVPLILKMIDVNDNAPIFDKNVYEFILSSNLRNFTTTAFVKATDADAEEPNNVIRYEIISGNYEDKFRLDKFTGQFTLNEPLTVNRKSRDSDIFLLTIRAYDLGVPVMFTTTTVRVYPPESKMRTVTFVLPGRNIDRKKTEEILSTITGGRVIIHDIQPLDDNDDDGNGSNDLSSKQKSTVKATVLYDSNSVVDISQIQRRLQFNNSTAGIVIRDSTETENLYKAENKILFWLLIAFAALIAAIILALLLCCICPWCPLYNATRKRVIRARSTEDDVHLVHRELDVGKQTKSVQVAEWMGRREAWSAERSTDSQTKPTHWEFRRRDNNREVVDVERAHSANEKISTRIKNNFKETRAMKDAQFHNSRTNLINDRENYEDTDGEMEHKMRAKQQIDDDSMRKHEIERGSDMEYEPSTFRRTRAEDSGARTNREQYFIRDGSAEILRLITRGKPDDENIYVNIPPQQSQYVMVENAGKEILMKRFIDEQANGKHIVREHYQVVPTAHDGISLPLNDKMASEVKLIHTNPLQTSAAVEPQLQPAYSNQSIHAELETSLKQQNALLRQILMEKEKLQEKYNQQETALETQSLPSHTMAIATQTECEAGTQTDPISAKPRRRRARSENDDSMTEDEIEYVMCSQANSPGGGIYWVKRCKPKRGRNQKTKRRSRGRHVMVEQVKRNIRTPIKEENEENAISQSPPQRYPETRSSILRRMANENRPSGGKSSARLSKELLKEISDSFDERPHNGDTDHGNVSSTERRNKFRKTKRSQQRVEYSDDEDDVDFESAEEVEIDSDNEIVIRRNNYSDSLDDEYSDGDATYRRHYRNVAFSRQASCGDQKEMLSVPMYDSDGRRISYGHSVASTPQRVSRRDAAESNRHYNSRRQASSEPPRNRSSMKASSAMNSYERHYEKSAARSEVDLSHRWPDDPSFESTKPRYMEWYYNRARDGKDKRPTNKKSVSGIEKRVKAKRNDESIKYKPEPMVRGIPPKGARMLKEDVQLNKTHAPKIQTETNHPLLQYSEHRYEHEYNPAPDIPVPPTKLPHYMYPETPPLPSVESSRSQRMRNQANNNKRAKPSPIREHEVKESSSRQTSQVEINQSASKQLNAATLEDDHDSGIAMNSLLHSLGKRNPIADKKSVFTIAYDESKIKKIQSESDSPQAN